MINDLDLIVTVPEGPSITDDSTIEERFQRTQSYIRACQGLKDPEKEIRELVEAARLMLGNFLVEDWREELESALKPFEEKFK